MITYGPHILIHSPETITCGLMFDDNKRGVPGGEGPWESRRVWGSARPPNGGGMMGGGNSQRSLGDDHLGGW